MKLKIGIYALLLCIVTVATVPAYGVPEPTVDSTFVVNGDTQFTDVLEPVSTQPANTAPVPDLNKTDSALIKVAEGLGVKVDPDASPAEISEQIVGAYKLWPGKGAPPEIWLRFVLFVLGVILTLYFAGKKLFKAFKKE